MNPTQLAIPIEAASLLCAKLLLNDIARILVVAQSGKLRPLPKNRICIKKGLGRQHQTIIKSTLAALRVLVLLNFLKQHHIAALVVICHGHFVCIKRPFLYAAIG